MRAVDTHSAVVLPKGLFVTGPWVCCPQFCFLGLVMVSISRGRRPWCLGFCFVWGWGGGGREHEAAVKRKEWTTVTLPPPRKVTLLQKCCNIVVKATYYKTYYFNHT